MFQSIRQNSPFYILDKKDNLSLKIGSVISVSNAMPRYDSMKYGVMPSPNDTIVDIKVRVGEEDMDFKGLPASLSIANFNGDGMVVSESRECMLEEVESIVRTSKSILDSVDYHKQNLSSCDAILRELSPSFAKDKAQEEKISALETKMVGIEGTLESMMAMLSNALGQSKNKKVKEE